jgi:hypothetical protein
MGDLPLISLNNSIVGLRKPIAKAVVHIIHKLSRQVCTQFLFRYTYLNILIVIKDLTVYFN